MVIDVTTKRKEVMITTEDNPYDPFTDFNQWHTFDVVHDYHTLALLGRITFSSHELSELDQQQELEMAIDEMILYNITGNYVKLEREI